MNPGHSPLHSLSGVPTHVGGGIVPGTMLGKYRLVEPVGRGGMGEVWKAHDTLAEITVAIKFLPPELQGNVEELSRIKAAYQRVQGLSHPGIGALKDLASDPRVGLFQVMAFIEGQSLSAYRRSQMETPAGFGAKDIARILHGVAAALDYAHAQRVVHRDIKPENILIDREGRPVVVDFGLAAEIRSSLTRVSRTPQDTSGTLPYMAPEQWRGERVDGASDQYALAVVAYQLFTGGLPFDISDAAALRLCVLDPNTRLPEAEEIPPAVHAVLSRAMSHERRSRFGSCMEFAATMEAAIQPREAPLEVVDFREPAKPQARPKPVPSPQPPTRPVAEAPTQGAKPAPRPSDPPRAAAPFVASPPMAAAPIAIPQAAPSPLAAPPASRTVWILGAAACLMVFCLVPLGVLVAPSIYRTWSASRTFQTTANLKNIGIAVQNYNDTHRVFPAGGTFSEAGVGHHGWMTRLLPLVEQDPLYYKIDFREPWDSPVNRDVFMTTIPMYRNPSVTDPTTGGFINAHYAGNSQVLGRNVFLPDRQIIDGFSMTILAGEVAAGFQPWGSPENTRDPAAGLGVSASQFGPVGTDATHIVLLDGSVRGLSSSIDPAVLRALATPAGKDFVPDEY